MRLILSFIMLFSFLCAKEYIFTYKIAVKNGITIKEEYNFSGAMISARDLDFYKNANKKCEITHDAKTERSFLKDYKQEILECFFAWGIKLEDFTKSFNHKSTSITYLAIPPTRVDVEYAKGIATISQLIKRIN